MLKFTGLALSCFAALVAGCTEARIAVPANVAASAEQLTITGMGFGERGRFSLASSTGSFYRQALSDRHRDFARSPERVVTYHGDSGFEVQGPDFTGTVVGSCSHLEQEVGTRSFSVTQLPFQYRCSFFRDRQRLDGDLLLTAAPRVVGPLTAETRIGRLTLAGRPIDIRPIHHSPNLKIPTSEPLGYRFVSAGEDIGALDVNGERKTIYALRGTTDREAVLIASLALAVLWKN